MKRVYAPGCALLIYKQRLVKRILEYLNENLGDVSEHLIFCRHNPNLDSGVQIINTCAGCDSLYSTLSTEQIKEQMKRRANEMECDDVVVYCISCIKSMYIGGKKPRYIIDLLYGEETEIGTYEPDAWHGELQKFIEEH